ncbi:MAG TPA: efflux RND transporter periplasmic adaptor subunit [Phycisphaerae bacterium]|nr:efflux RND transporter periplasmic adaptor subunit [Phycisphaerae bacterium]
MRRTAVIFVVAAVVIISWLYWQKVRPAPFVVSGFIEADEIRVGSRVGGRVAEVIAYEGQRVGTGTLLYRIDPFDLMEQLAEAKASAAANKAEHDRLAAGYRKEEIEQARAKRDEAKATLDKLVAGPRPQEIETARQHLNIAKAGLEFAEAEHARLLKLRQEAQAAPTEFDQAVKALKAGQAEVAEAEQQLSLLLAGTRPEEIAAAQAALADAEQALKLMEAGYRPEDVAKAAAQLAAAEAKVAAIETQIKELEVNAPCDCVVEAIDLRPGDIVAANAPSAALLDPSRLWVRAYVPESRLGQVRLDQRVPIHVDSFPGRRFAAHVTFIAREAEFTPRNIQTPEERSKQVFRIKVTLDEGLDRLRAGMSADVLLDEKIGP